MTTTVPFKLLGNKYDSKRTFTNTTRDLIRKYNVSEFMEAAEITARAPFDNFNASVKQKQEIQVNLFYSELISMAGSVSIEGIIGRIETNTLNDRRELTTNTRKARQLLQYYQSLVENNTQKDFMLSQQRDRIVFEIQIQLSSNLIWKKCLMTLS